MLQYCISRLEFPSKFLSSRIYPEKPGDHKPEGLHSLFQRSLEALHGVSIRIFYLHAPDRSVPFKETLRAVDELYRKGHLYVSLRCCLASPPIRISAKSLV